MKRRFSSAIVLGKFMPPHVGHRFVIQAAQQQSERVTLIVSTLPNDPIAVELRVSWLQRLYPQTTVVIMPVKWDVTNAQAWAAGALAALGGQRPQAVFSSEDYGLQLAELWNCTHVMIDRERTAVPVSASAILADPPRFSQWLDPSILRDLVNLKIHS